MSNFLDSVAGIKEKEIENTTEDILDHDYLLNDLVLKEENIRNLNNITLEQRLKVDKNYLFSKEATKLVIDNYDDLVIKSDFLNYLMENLTEYHQLGDFSYINSFLFPEERSSITDDLIEKILNQKYTLLFDYYLTTLFKTEESFDFINGILYVLKANHELTPEILREYYAENLHAYLTKQTTLDIEQYYKLVKEKFKPHADAFIADFYMNFMIPSIKNKTKEAPVKNMQELTAAINFISNYPELKYDRTSRVIRTSYELLNTKDNYYTYDPDILYDIQEVVEKIVVNDKILDYNLVYFCSYFDKKIYFRKALNLIVNIQEGVNTISISKTKYENINKKTIDESLNFLEWILFNHNRDSKSSDFRNAVKDFISYNWSYFTANNKSFINLKATLRDYGELDKIIEEVKFENVKGFNSFYSAHGPFVFSTVISIVFFSLICYFGIGIMSNILDTIEQQWKFVTIIMIEIVITGILMIIMTNENPKKRK